MEPLVPSPHIGGLDHSIRRDRTTTLTVRAGIGQENCISVPQQQVRISKHVGPIGSLTMQKDHSIAIADGRPHAPRAQDRTIVSGDHDVCQNGMIPRGDGACVFPFRRSQGDSPRMERALDCNKAYRSAQGEPHRNASDSPQNRRPHANHFFKNTRSRKNTFPVRLRLPSQARRLSSIIVTGVQASYGGLCSNKPEWWGSDGDLAEQFSSLAAATLQRLLERFLSKGLEQLRQRSVFVALAKPSRCELGQFLPVMPFPNDSLH